eukprot:205273_1
MRDIEPLLFTRMVPDDVVALLQFYSKQCADECGQAASALIKLYNQNPESPEIIPKLQQYIAEQATKCINNSEYSKNSDGWVRTVKDPQILLYSLIHLYDTFRVVIQQHLHNQPIFIQTLQNAFKNDGFYSKYSLRAFMKTVFDSNKQTITTDLTKTVQYIVVFFHFIYRYIRYSKSKDAFVVEYEDMLAQQLCDRSALQYIHYHRIMVHGLTNIMIEKGRWIKKYTPEQVRKFDINDEIEVKEHGKFYKAKVIGVKKDKIKIHYIGWSDRYDEYINIDGYSNRLKVNTIMISHSLLDDLEASNKLNRLLSMAQLPIDYNVFVASYSSWPLMHTQAIKLPLDNDIRHCIDNCRETYSNLCDNKKTLWFQMNRGRASIEIEFRAQNTKILSVSTYQMIVLLLFNTKNVYTFQQILDITRIPVDGLYSNLMAMSNGTNNILQKTPNGTNIESCDKFQINSLFEDKRKYINLPIIKANESSMTKLYIHQMNAAIVRIMKARKTLRFKYLREEVERQLSKNNSLEILPNLSCFEQRLSSLVSLQYLEIDEKDSQLYHYCM